MKGLKILIVVIILIVIIAGAVMLVKENGAKEENVFTIGLDDSYPPMGFRNEKNEIVGFDIDIANAVCEKLGMKLKLQQITWASKEDELDSESIDCIWNGFAYNEDRAAKMTLTEPYIKGEMYFLLRNGSTIKNQEELKGKKIGVQSGSIQAQDLENSEFGKNVEMIEYRDNLTACMDLEAGGVDAVFCSNIIGNYIITDKKKDYITIPSVDITTSKGSVIAFKKGNTELRDKIQNALYELKEEGKLTEISEKWFGKDMVIVK